MESTVTRTLQEHFQNTVYPIILENISIREDGELENAKSIGSTTDTHDCSMTSESFHRECREEHAFKLKSCHKENCVSVNVINTVLVDLHSWIETGGMAYSRLSEKVAFLENLLKSFRQNFDGHFFTEILPQVLMLRASSFKNDYIDGNVEDQAAIRNFLLASFYQSNPEILDNLSLQKLSKEFAERIKVLVTTKDIKNYQDIVKLFLTDSVKDSGQTSGSGNNSLDYTATDFIGALQQLADYLQGKNDNAQTKNPSFLEFGSLDIKIVENEWKSRQTLGMLHPIILLNYLENLEKYKMLFYEIKMLSYGVTEMLDGTLLKVATGLVIEDVKIFDPEEFSSFIKRTKLLYYNVEDISGVILPKESGTHWTTSLRASMEVYTQHVNGVLAAFSVDDVEAEKKTVDKKEKKVPAKRYLLSRDNDAKINLGDLKIPGRHKIRELERAMINAEWNNTPIDYSQIDLNSYENGEFDDDDVYLTTENVTGEEIFACVLNKPDSVSPIDYLIDHHWRVLFLKEVSISEKKTKIFLERLIDSDTSEELSLQSVGNFIRNVNDSENPKEYV